MEPSLATVIRAAMESRLAEVHTMIPGSVISYDSTEQTASIQPMVKQRVPAVSEVDGYIYEQLPVIHNVPVSFPQGGGSFIRWTLREGDKVALVFSEVDTSQFRNLDEQAEPGDDTRHGLSYPIAYPGFMGSSTPQGTAEDGEMVIEAENTIKLGNDADEFIARADKVLSELQEVATAFNGHTHGYIVPPATLPTTPTTGPKGALLVGNRTYSADDVSCDKVKGK